MHQGIVKENGIVDTARLITDPADLQTVPSDDGLHLDNFHPGNFEWWYFDIMDEETGCILKIVAHLGTDPLRRKFLPQLAFSVKVPDVNTAFAHLCELEEFKAAHDECNVKIAQKFHCYGKNNTYHIWVDIPGFSGEFTFTRQLPGWKPLGDAVPIEQRKRRAVFGWIIPVPKAAVTGDFTFNGRNYQLRNASGYHDHNFWKVGKIRKLFIDDVISKWYWGRFKAGDYIIIFMNTHFRNNQISSFYISTGKELIHSSNNAVQVQIVEQKLDRKLKCSYPVKSLIRSLKEPRTFQLVLKTREVLDRKDLLAGVNPFLGFLIKTLVSRPAYLGLKADCHLIKNDQNIHGTGIFELMLFRNRVV